MPFRAAATIQTNDQWRLPDNSGYDPRPMQNLHWRKIAPVQ